MATEPTQAVLTIDLGAIAENHRRLRRVAEGAEVAAVVKADGKFYTAVKEVKVTIGGCG